MKSIPWGDDVLAELPYGRRILMPTSDLSIAPEVALYNNFDPKLSYFMHEVIKPGQGDCVDVGANYGIFSLQMPVHTQQQGFVHSFEPNPRIFEYLRKNIQLNWLEGNVYAHDMAVGHEKKKVSLNVVDGLDGGGTLNPITEPNTKWSQYDVWMVTLDEYLGTDTRIQFMKIDVEGSECYVLQGARGLFEGGVGYCSMELRFDVTHREEQSLVVQELYHLKDLGYKFSLLPNYKKDVSLAEICDVHQYENIIIRQGS